MATLPQLELMHNGLFRLKQSYTYVFPWDEDCRVVIPMGMLTNFASIPWFARWVVSRTDRHILIPALVHDYLVSEFFWDGRPAVIRSKPNGEEWRERCDWRRASFILKRMMEAEGAPTWKRMLVHWAVRAYGVFRDK